MPELKYTSNYCCDICADGYHYFTYGDWETSWLDWEMIDELKEELEEFAKENNLKLVSDSIHYDEWKFVDA